MSYKFAPCSQYNSPQIEYTRNNQKFCRNKSRFAKDKLIKTPPCDKYPGNYVEYTRDNKKYCRETNIKSIKKNDNLPKINFSKSLKKDSVFDTHTEKNIGIDKCMNFSDSELEKICHILNINKKKSKDEICDIILNMINNDTKESLTGNIYYSTSIEDIYEVCHLLNIKLYDETLKKYKNLDDLSIEICQIVMKYSTLEFKNLIYKLINPNPECSIQTGYIITKIIKNILYPNQFPRESPIPISEQLYEKLLLMKKKKILNNETEKYLVKKSLHTKICHCIKKVLITDKFKKEVLNISSKYNPYAVCTSSIYKDRHIRVPAKEVKNCPVDFTWYNKLDYLNEQKRKKSTKKYSKSKLEGGQSAICSDNCGFDTVSNVQSNNCSIINNEVKMMEWPNIFSNGTALKGSGWP